MKASQALNSPHSPLKSLSTPPPLPKVGGWGVPKLSSTQPACFSLTQSSILLQPWSHTALSSLSGTNYYANEHASHHFWILVVKVGFFECTLNVSNRNDLSLMEMATNPGWSARKRVSLKCTCKKQISRASGKVIILFCNLARHCEYSGLTQ